jgi:hypothetical protein
LRDSGVPDEVVTKLKSLKHEDFPEEVFWEMVKEQIGEADLNTYDHDILESVVPPYRKGHYGRTEAVIFARAVYEKLQTLQSYQQYRQRVMTPGTPTHDSDIARNQ